MDKHFILLQSRDLWRERVQYYPESGDIVTIERKDGIRIIENLDLVISRCNSAC